MSYLNLCVVGDEAKLARNKFDNVDTLNRLEAWRRLVVPLEPKSLATRHALQQRMQVPAKAKNLSGVLDALEQWDKDVTKYVTTGGENMRETEKVGVALRVLPKDIDHSIV